jgi:uncharacterized membrane protein YukC
LKSVNDKLSKKVNLSPTIVYIGLGLVVIGIVAVVYFVMPLASEVKEQADVLDAIRQSLGIPAIVPPP